MGQMRETDETFPHLTTINWENLIKLKLIFVSCKKNKIAIFIISNMNSTALISCRIKIDLYLLNCHHLNPAILQTMSFVNSTCLKILRTTFCFTTISMKVNEGNIFTSLKDSTSSNAQFRDQNCFSSLRKLLCLLFGLFVFLFLLWLLLVYMFLHGD